MSDSPSPGDNYEFTEAQNVEFRNAAYWIGIMGRLAIVCGVLMSLGIIALRFDLLIQGIVSIIIGIWTLNVASAFKRVADTTGRDVENMIEAVLNLKKLYRLQVVLIVIVIVAVLVLLAVSVLVSIQAGSSAPTIHTSF